MWDRRQDVLEGDGDRQEDRDPEFKRLRGYRAHLWPVLRSHHFFGRLRLRTSEVPELAPGKKGSSGSRQKRAAPGGSGSSSWHYNFSLQLWTILLIIKIIFGSYYLYKLNWLHVYILQEQDLSFLLSLKIQQKPECRKKRLFRLRPTKKSAPAPQHCLWHCDA